MICLDKLIQAYVLAALNTKEAHAKQTKQMYDDVPNYKICDLVMIKTLTRSLPWMQSMYLTSDLCM